MTTFYVAPTGKDTNAGTAAKPFLTLQKAVSVLVPGDTLNVLAFNNYQGFVCGYDSVAVLAGTQAAPITIQADPTAAPGSVLITSQNNKEQDGITFDSGSSWVTVKGILVKNTGKIPRDCIRVVQCDSISIVNCEVTGATRFGVFTTLGTGFRVEGCNIHDNPGKGDGTSGHAVYISNGSVNPIIRNNIITKSGSQGIHVNGDASEPGGGVITGAQITGNIIGNNVNNGINCDGMVNSLMQNNLIYGSTKTGISLYKITANAPCTGNKILNNTIYSPNGSGSAIQLANAATGNTVLNNILLGGADGTMSVSADSRPGLASDYNIVSDKFTNYDTETASSLAQWRAATGQDAHSVVAAGAALFTNASANDYTLKPGSPATGKGQGGADIGYTGNPGAATTPPANPPGLPPPRAGMVYVAAQGAADASGDGVVDIADMVVVSNNWNARKDANGQYWKVAPAK